MGAIITQKMAGVSGMAPGSLDFQPGAFTRSAWQPNRLYFLFSRRNHWGGQVAYSAA